MTTKTVVRISDMLREAAEVIETELPKQNEVQISTRIGREEYHTAVLAAYNLLYLRFKERTANDK